MGASTFSHTALSRTTIERAWTALQLPATWEAIGGVADITDPEHTAAGTMIGFRFTADAGGRRYPGQARAVRSEAPRRMTVEIDTSELSGEIDVVLAPVTDGSTEVRVNMSVQSKGWMARVAFPLIAASIGSGLPASVESFAARLAATAPGTV